MDINLFPFPIFPPASLDSSVTTTVWVGVLVVAFFNLRLGWIFSGLVVPGYLVPLLIARPISAAVIVGEAILVYLIVRTLSDLSPRTAPWSSFFGRDRFVSLVLTSIILRLVLDGWALPRAAHLFEQQTGWSVDLGNELQSFGLVIVALMANQLWKPGLFGGLLQVSTTTGVTLLIVRGVLMEWTNFDLGAIEYMYEDIAASILASPKAYIILLTTAFIASRLNLLYGWEYSGVLIPALLALQWYEPAKLLASLIEAWVVLGISSALLESRLFRSATVEKASKVALFFTVSYLYKYILGFGVLLVAPQIKVSDIYAFGYLLPSLLAVKMHEKNLGLRMTRFTVQTTLVSAAVALLVGFGLTLLPRRGASAGEVATATSAPSGIVERDTSWTATALAARVAINRGRQTGGYRAADATELAAFGEAMAQLVRYAEAPSSRSPEGAPATLARLGFVVERLQGRHLLIREREPERGWGFFLLRLGSSADLAFEVPRPLDEWATTQAGLTLYRELDARALAVAGATATGGAADASRRPDTPFHAFHRLMAGAVTQIRGAEERLRDAAPVGPAAAAPSSGLWVKSELPAELDLRRLETVAGAYRIEWGRLTDPSIQWRQARTGFAELQLTRAARERLLVSPIEGIGAPEPRPYEQPIEGYLHRWLLVGKGRIAARGSEVYVPPRLEQMIFFDEEVVTPIVHLVREGYEQGELTSFGRAQWRRSALAAALYGYEVIWYRHVPSGRDYLILQEVDPAERFWGTYVFRLGASQPFLVHVPRPKVERRTFEVGVALFEELGASMLSIAGTHPFANSDSSSDLIRVDNKVSLFNLVNQATLREAGEEPRFVLLCRAFAETDDPNEPSAMIAAHDGSYRVEQLGPLGRLLVTTLEKQGVSPRFVDGSPGTASYEVGTSPQVRYLDQTLNKQLAVLWLSAATRGTFRVDSEESLRDAPLEALGVDTTDDDVRALIAGSAPSAWSAVEVAELVDLLGHYVETADFMALRRMMGKWQGLRFVRVIDRNSPRAFLLLFDAEDRFVAAVNLQLRDAGEPVVASTADLAQSARQFLDQRRAMLIVGGSS